MAVISLQNWRVKIILGLILLINGWLRPAAAAAKDNGELSITPAFQEIVLSETTSIASASVELKNQSPITQTFSLQAVEVQQFDDEGNITLQDKPLTNQNPNAKFIKLTENQIVIPAQTSLSVPVEILNSIDLSPGGHYAVLIARLQTDSTENQVLPALSAFFVIRKVGGEQFNLSLKASELLSKVWWKLPTKTELTFSNQGNVHVIPHGSIEIRDIFGRLVAQDTLNENSLFIFPATQRELPQSITQIGPVLPISPLYLKIEGTSQPGGTPFIQQGWVLLVSPWLLLPVVVIVLVLSGLFIRRKLHAKG